MRARTTGRWRGTRCSKAGTRRTCGRWRTGRSCSRTCKRAGATEGAVTPAPSLIVIDADLPGTPGDHELIKALKQDPKHKRIPVVVLGADDDPETVAGRLRGRREHVHRQAGHVPRARAADEGLHRVLAGDRRAAQRRWPPAPQSAARPRRLRRRRPPRARARAAARARIDARDDARGRRSTPLDARTRTTSSLVDREIDPPGADGLRLAEELVTAAPQTPVIVLSHAADKRRRRRGRGAPASPTSCSSPASSRDRLEHAIRYAITHQRTLQKLAESEERHALALARRQRRHLGLGRRHATASSTRRAGRAMLGYREHEVGETRGEWLGRVHADDRAPLTQALDAYAQRHAPTEHFEFEHRAAAPRRQLPLDARARDRGPRRSQQRPPASSARSPTSPTAARPSAASSTTRSTTRSPACRTACCSSTASTSRSAAPSATTPSAARRCCSSTSTASRSSTTALGHAAGDQLLQGRRAAGSRRRCGPTTPSRGSAATSSRSCSTTCASRARRRSSPSASCTACRRRSCSTGASCSSARRSGSRSRPRSPRPSR